MTSFRRLIGCAAAVVLSLSFTTPALAWWNSDWPFRMKVHLDTTPKGANIADPIGQAQVLLRLSAQTGFNFDKVVDPNGADLRVIAGDDRTPLSFQIEHYDSLSDLNAQIWINVPSVAPNQDNAIYLYWGKKGEPAKSDGKATFAPDRLLVYHFAEEKGPVQDATGVNTALTPVSHGSGIVAGGASFNGATAVALPKSPSLAVAAGAAMAWSMWVKLDANAATQTSTLFSQGDGAQSFTIGLAQGAPYVEIVGAAGTNRTPSTTPLDATAWHLIVVTASDKVALSVDGGPAVEMAVSLPAVAGGGSLGGVLAAAPGPAVAVAPGGSPQDATPVAASSAFTGLLDEFEITRGVVPPGVVKLWLAEMKNPERLVGFDIAEENSFVTSLFGTGSPFVVIFRSVTPDAWFVIGLLALMSVISWWTMVSKALLLGRVSSANAVFEQQYRVISAPGATAGATVAEMSDKRTPQLRRSPLYRIYRVGRRELELRLAAGLLEADGRLASQSIEAMRASVDATLVRESQRLSSLMVLLTICISGGPFLGLLGTVVGVMITFAAIAQAGDVNVNAIAPGIAAALLATVAGLFVAIPALFGYNYLLTRIKESNARMNAFSNELVTRMAEQVRTPTETGSV